MPLEQLIFILDVKHIVIMTPTVATYATLSDKQQGIFYMHFPTDRTAQPLMDQLWTTGWNGKYPQLQMQPLCMIDRVIQTFTGRCSTA